MSGPEHDQPRVALVTGATRGTGREIAAELEQSGMQVWRLNRRPTGLGGERELICDLADLAAVTKAVEHIVTASGRLDVVVANAVERYFSPMAQIDLNLWSHAVSVNLSSVVALVQAALPALRTAHGTIVLMGSHAGTRFFEGGASYCATKAAFKALCEVLLLEERPNGVRTSLISPGAIANEDGDTSALKMTTTSVAQLVRWVASAPPDVAVGEIELRPARLPTPTVAGIDRLQAV